MGSGYNTSVAAGRSARNRASVRTPVYFWLDVPYYVYDLGCGTTTLIHVFRSRTPAVPVNGEFTFWCDRCRSYKVISEIAPTNRPISTDEVVAMEQDKGVLRERIARELQSRGYLNTDEQIALAAAEFGVPVLEIKRINIALTAPEGQSGLPDVCRAGLHEMTVDNTLPTTKGSEGTRRCRACQVQGSRERMQRMRARKAGNAA